MPCRRRPLILGDMTITTGTTVTRRLAIALVPLLLAAACGGSSTPHTLADTTDCFRSHGVALTLTSGSDQDDPDAQLISDFMGYQGSLGGSFHGHGFTVDVFDKDVWLNPGWRSSDDAFAPLDGCFDEYGS